MSQENSDKTIPTMSPDTGDVDPPTVSSEPANAGYEYYEETGPPRESAVLYYDEDNFSEEPTKQSSTHSGHPVTGATPPKRHSQDSNPSIEDALYETTNGRRTKKKASTTVPMEVDTTAHDGMR